MKIIGIDIGTTTISGVVLNYADAEAAEVLEAKTIENGCFLLTGHKWERIQDAGTIVKKAGVLLDEFLERHPDV